MPPTPDEAAGLLGVERLPLAEKYAALLATDGVTRGLIGPREAARLWDRHLFNCAAIAEAIPDGASVCDLGSGAGLPGVVLAIVRPDLRVTLVEPLLRRTTFLEEVVDLVGLAGVSVVRGRAEQMAKRHEFDVVTSRALAPLGRLLGWSMPLVAPTGVMLAMKGSSVAGEIAEARETLRALACAEPEILTLGDSSSRQRTLAVRVAWSDPATVGLPA